MINILHINTTKGWRGGDIQMLTTYNLLSKKSDLQQFIFCPQDSKMAGVLRKLHIPHVSARQRYKLSPRYLIHLDNLIRAQSIHIVHAHDSYALALALILSRFHWGLKIIYSRKRNNIIPNKYYKTIKYNSPRLTKIVCVSEAVNKVFDGILTEPQKLTVIYDAIDVESFSNAQPNGFLHAQHNLPADTFLIGNVAALTAQKDLYTFLDAAKMIIESSDKKIAFFIVGEGELKAELQTYAIKNNIDQQVIFTGYRDDVQKILPEFDLLMISSETEGLPLTLMEAFASKVAVVATDAGGVSEAIQHQVTGMLSPIKDSAALAKNALQLMVDEPLRQKVIDAAFELVRNKFSLPIMAENYYQLYTGVAQQGD